MARPFLAALLALSLVAGLLAVAPPAGAVGTFTDDDGNAHESDIEAIAAAGIAKGCNPPANTAFCPDQVVTRGQMAAFLTRLFDLPSGKKNRFNDDNGSIFEDDINAIGKAGITVGCNPPANTAFCPDRLVTRGEMAAFLARALDLDSTGGDYFADDSSSLFQDAINAMARVGITRGCNPPSETNYCPDDPVRRDEMATFLARTMAIDTTGTTSTTRPRPTTTTTAPRQTTTTSGRSSTTTTPPSTATGAFLESGGIVVMEVESVPAASGWSRQTSSSGYTGSAYYNRTGSHTTDEGQGTLTYRFRIETPGTYAVSIRSRRDRSPGENVENGQRNDVFVQINSGNWWKATTHAAFGSWGWIDKRTVSHATFQPMTAQFGAGNHTVKISGRSQYIKIDRVHVFKVNQGSSLRQIQAANPPASTPESRRAP